MINDRKVSATGERRLLGPRVLTFLFRGVGSAPSRCGNGSCLRKAERWAAHAA